MSTYINEWDCCDSVSHTESWEPDECPFCAVDALRTERDHLARVLASRDDLLTRLRDRRTDWCEECEVEEATHWGRGGGLYCDKHGWTRTESGATATRKGRT